MSISQLLQKGIKALAHTSQTPELDAEVLLAHVLQKDKAYLYSHGEEIINEAIKQEYFSLVNRRSKAEPIAYLTNKKEFYGLEFYVDKNVLIPRPETEQLVDLVMEVISSSLIAHRPSLRIIDVGTGCGNIGIAIVNQLIVKQLNRKGKFEIYMTDISGKAVKIAKKNHKKLIKNAPNVKVKFVKADLFDDMSCKFDIIVSNPPYIPAKDIEFLDPNVRKYEPRVALNGGVGGLEVVKKLISKAAKQLTRGGALLFEMHERHPNEIKYYIEENHPDWKAKFMKDCFGDWRFCRISQ